MMPRGGPQVKGRDPGPPQRSRGRGRGRGHGGKNNNGKLHENPATSIIFT